MGGAAASAIGSAIGNIGGTLYSGHQSRRAARKQRKFIRNMRSTAYQATMEDMRQAGLNPILAYQQGATQSGMGSMALTPDLSRLGSDIAGAGAAASQAASAKEQAGSAKGQRAAQSAKDTATLSLITAQKGNIDADTGVKNQQANTLMAQMGQLEQSTRTSAADMSRTNVEVEKLRTQLHAAYAEQRIDKSLYGEVMRNLSRFSRAIQGIPVSGNLNVAPRGRGNPFPRNPVTGVPRRQTRGKKY